MSKAEEKAKERYWLEPNDIETQEKYAAYIEGYHQAEKDNELTWEDINRIKLIIEQVECDYVEQDKKLYTKYFYKEVLKRFRKMK